MGLLDFVRRHRAPKPNPPGDVELGQVIGEYGGPTSGYARMLSDRLGSILPTDALDARIIDRMRRHYQIAAGLTVLSIPGLRSDHEIECTDDDEREWMAAAYGRVHPIIMRSAMRALWAGYSPNALVWDVDAELGGIVPVGVRDLDPVTCTPRRDEQGTFTGFVQTPMLTGGSSQPIDVPLDYSLWITEGMESGNLFGRSVLLAALDPWADAAAFRIFHARALERFGEPVVKARYPVGRVLANADAIAAAAAETPPRTVEPVYVDNSDRALDMGENLRNHSVLAMPSDLLFGADGKPVGFSWDIDFLEAAKGEGGAFVAAIEACDRRISRAMFIPDLLFANSDTGAYALGQSHRSIFDAACEARLDDYARQITAQVLDRMRLWNFGPRAPEARLVFAPQADTDREELWQVALELIADGRLPVETEALAARLGIPLAAPEDASPEDTAANPFASVGLPALVQAGIITRDEARELLGVDGAAPPEIDMPTAPPAAPADDAAAFDVSRRALALAAERAAQVGKVYGPAERRYLRRALGLRPEPRPRVELAAKPADTGSLPEWQVPQAIDPPRAYVRDANARERRVPFARVETELNRVERVTLDTLDTVLERERERVERQLAAIVRDASSTSDVLARLGTIDVRGGPEIAAAWRNLMGDVWGVGLDSVRVELAAYADAVPTTLGAEGRAYVSAHVQAVTDRVLAQLTSDVRVRLLNAYTSSVSRAGMSSVIAQVFDTYERSEGAGPRLTTRMLSSKALNASRADAIARGGIPLRGAQYSALLDRRVCELCRRLDEQVIPIEHTDYGRFTPPVHHNCRCVWVYITADEVDFTPTWEGAPPSMVGRFGGLVI